MCTHGPDPAPEGVDPTVPQPLAGAGHPQGLLFPDPSGGPQGAVAHAAPTIACYGDGESGNRVQAVYAVPSDRPDRYDQVVGSIRVWAAEMDTVFQQSAAKGGGRAGSASSPTVGATWSSSGSVSLPRPTAPLVVRTWLGHPPNRGA
jgi:hypothetical protein